VDSEPEFLAPHQEFFNWADIDAILISNYTCMLALPYITEKTGFR
jgi:integrator complex subunit 9